MSTIVEFIMGVGNKLLIEGAKKFGYTYVDPNGTTYVESHYDAAGHVFVANKIIEALPNADFYNKNHLPQRKAREQHSRFRQVFHRPYVYDGLFKRKGLLV